MYNDTILFTDDGEATRQEVKSYGGQVTFDFGSGVIVARLPESVDPASLGTSRLQPPDSLGEQSKFWIDAWNLSRTIEPREDEAPLIKQERRCLSEIGAQPRSAELLGPGAVPRMCGKIAVVLLIVSGTGPRVIPASDVTQATAETLMGLGFLQSLNPVANVEFILANDLFNPKKPIQVGVQVEPCTVQECGEGEEELCEQWLNDAMLKLGYSPNRGGVANLAQDAKAVAGADSAYVVAITRYRVCYYAYASLGGSLLVIGYTTSTMSIGKIHRVVAHESCHIFSASDEYSDKRQPCEKLFGDVSTLGVPNHNSIDCEWNPPEPGWTPITCLMGDFFPLDLCEFTRWQVGWNNREMPRQVVGPVGGRRGLGSPYSLTFGLGARIVEVKMFSGSFIDSLHVVAEVPTVGRVSLSAGGPLGSPTRPLTLDTNERIVEISGTCADYIHSLKIRTSLGQELLAGTEDGSISFSYEIPEDRRVSGFWGKSGSFLDAIGLILDPSGSAPSPDRTRLLGPSGSWGGSPFRISPPSIPPPPAARFRVTKVIIRHGAYIDAIGLEYEVNGTTMGEMAGGDDPGAMLEEFPLMPGEFIVGIAGRYGNYVDSIIIQTNQRFSKRYGGRGGDMRFNYTLWPNEEVVGFFGRNGNYIDALGCIFMRRR